MDDVIVSKPKRVRQGSIGVGLVGGAMVVAALLYMSPAFACTVHAGIRPKPGRHDPGSVVRVELTGFQAGGNPVNVYWGGGSTNAVLASVAPQTARFDVDVTIPANAIPGREYLVSAHQDADFPYDGAAILRIARTPVVAPPAPGASPAPAPPSPAPAAETPAPQAAPAPEAAPVVAPAQATAAPAQARRADALRPSPADASGFSSSGVSAYAPGTQEAAPLVVDQRQAFGQPGGHLASGRSPWILVPLGLVGLVLLSAAGASVVRQTRSQGVRAPA